MNYGFHLATAGVVTGMRRLDTIANNLANAQTVGFKADYLNLEARRAEKTIKGPRYLSTRRLGARPRARMRTRRARTIRQYESRQKPR